MKIRARIFVHASRLAAAVLLLPFQVNAAADKVQEGLNAISSPFGNKGTSLTQTSAAGLIVKVINFALSVAFALAILFVIIAGFRYLTSAGNEEAAKKGKKTLIYALVGIVIIVLSYVLVNIVVKFAQTGI
jgi:hypothetical protein